MSRPSGGRAAGLPQGGVYVVVLRLGEARSIRVGRLGRFTLAAGRYAYVGSAQRGLPKRVARHARRRKTLRWHVDYLTRYATVEAAYAWPLPKEAECRLAASLAEGGGRRIVPGFGASDCGCGGHLLRLGARLRPAALRRLLGFGPASCVSCDRRAGRKLFPESFPRSALRAPSEEMIPGIISGPTANALRTRGEKH